MCNCGNTITTTTICTQPTDCSCPVKDLSTDCVLYTGEDLPCTEIKTGTILTEVFSKLDTYLCDLAAQLNNSFNLISVGEAVRVYRGVDGIGRKEIRSLTSANSILTIGLSVDDKEINFGIDNTALKSFVQSNQMTYTATNVGVGSGIYKESVTTGDNVDFKLKTITSAANTVYITQGIDEINLEADLSPLQTVDETNGEGIIIKNRDSNNYGNVGLKALDLSYSDTISTTRGATGSYSFASGLVTTASGSSSHAEGRGTTASGEQAHSEGLNTTASGPNSHAEGDSTVSSAFASHASGYDTIASGNGSHAEGDSTVASGLASHSEGLSTEASGTGAHAEGMVTIAEGLYSHAEGERTYAAGYASHAEGFNGEAIGKYSHVGGDTNYANSYAEFSTGYFGTNTPGTPNTPVSTDRLFNVGNGVSDIARSDAFTLLKNGLATLPSVTNTLILSGSGKAIITKEYLESTYVTLAGGGATTVTGTYPNFTISSTDTVADGSETIVTAGTNISVTGSGTVGAPYVVSNTLDVSALLAYLPRNRGYFSGLQIGSTSGTLPVSGDMTAATKIGEDLNNTTVLVTMANPMDNLNYVVKAFLESMSASIDDDNDVCAPVFKPISTTQFQISFKEESNHIQNITVHLEVCQL